MAEPRDRGAFEGVSDEGLFWKAYDGSNSPAAYSGIGAEIDMRIEDMQTDFRELWLSGSEATAEQRLAWAAFTLAQGHVNAAYGTLTGHRRKGCSMGAPVQYDGPRIFL